MDCTYNLICTRKVCFKPFCAHHIFDGRDNTERIELLDSGVEGKLFTANQILLLLQSTPSMKTHKDMIYRVGPRITDLKNVGIICDSFTQAADVSNFFTSDLVCTYRFRSSPLAEKNAY